MTIRNTLAIVTAAIGLMTGSNAGAVEATSPTALPPPATALVPAAPAVSPAPASTRMNAPVGSPMAGMHQQCGAGSGCGGMGHMMGGPMMEEGGDGQGTASTMPMSHMDHMKRMDQMGQMGHMGHMGKMGHAGHAAAVAQDMSEHIDGHIAFLRAELRIAEPQVAAWNGFAEALRNATKSRRESMAQPMPSVQTLGAGG
ncbi:MAG: hypothetical protein ABT940_11560, partial [Alphaproteobacteria bacterium]